MTKHPAAFHDKNIQRFTKKKANIYLYIDHQIKSSIIDHEIKSSMIDHEIKSSIIDIIVKCSKASALSLPSHNTAKKSKNPHPAAISRQSRCFDLTSAGSGVATQKGAVVLHIYGQKTTNSLFVSEFLIFLEDEDN